jgi:hypothetical protein
MSLKTLAPVTVTDADTPTQVSTSSLPATTVIIQAHEDNNAVIYVGDSAVDGGSGTERGIRLEAPASGIALPAVSIPSGSGPNELNLQDVWFSSPSASQKIQVMYVEG